MFTGAEGQSTLSTSEHLKQAKLGAWALSTWLFITRIHHSDAQLIHIQAPKKGHLAHPHWVLIPLAPTNTFLLLSYTTTSVLKNTLPNQTYTGINGTESVHNIFTVFFTDLQGPKYMK